VDARVDDEVLVGFEHGDIHRPYILGGLYNGKDKPNLELEKKAGDAGDLVSSGKTKRRGFVSRKGHRMVFVDDDSASQIAIKSSDGKLMIEWDEKKGELRITGENKVIVTSKKELTLQADMNIKIKAGTDIKLEAGTDAEVKSGTGLKLQGGTQVEVKGGAQVAVSGPMIKLG